MSVEVGWDSWGYDEGKEVVGKEGIVEVDPEDLWGNFEKRTGLDKESDHNVDNDG